MVGVRRVELKRFDLLLVKPRNLIGNIVSAVTDSPYSHVALVLDQWHVAETNWKYPLKVRHLTYPEGLFDVYRYRKPFSIAQIQSMESFLHLHLHTPYDVIQSITNGLYILTGFPITDTPNRMNCSEMVDKMFHAAGIDLSIRPLGKVTPADLAHSKELNNLKEMNNAKV